MATQRVFYECRFCKRLYDEEAQAVECEAHHEELSELSVIDGIDVNTDAHEVFPAKVLLKHNIHEDQLAEYTLVRQGSSMDFYQADEQWHQA